MAKITIKDNGGNILAQFDSTNDSPIATQGQNNGVPVPVACGVGACRMCVGQCNKGHEFINESAFGEKHIGTEENEVLTCISGIKEDAPADAEIEIQLENM
ncbi:2Fe-2S iron-sulfur cluster binding domain-containing protein [Candidatus Gracilibacteria bacterium]|nr:2Fe-2S iron-sulfur cluster binding domain-containing protein [Candidatus Gracilibacteria bacterium]